MPEPPAERDELLAFDGFVLDLRRGELRRDGASVPLRPQTFAALALLSARPGEMVSREELCLRLWPQARVNVDLGLNGCIKELRAALGDDARAPRVIETLPKRGYRFVGRLTRVASERPREASPPTAAVPRPPRPASSTLRLRVTLLAALLAALAIGGGTRRRPEQSARLLVALLPFQQADATPESAYLADGLTEELGLQLRRVAPARLGVIAHASSARYRAQPRDLPAIGRALGARFVVEGRLNTAGQRLRVALELADTQAADRRFAYTYEGDLRDVQALQRRVAREMAGELGVGLARAARDSQPPDDPRAYDLYLRALQAFNQRTPAGLEVARANLRQALELQPDCARAHALLAQVYFLTVDGGFVPRAQALDLVRQEAEAALRIDPTLAQAHIALAVHRVLDGWDWKGAELRYRLALSLDPNYATAHQWYANLLVNQRRTDEAWAEISRALELDPLSLIVNQAAASILLIAGRDAESGAQVQRLLALDANWTGTHFARARLLLKAGRAAEAVAAFERANPGSQSPTPLAWLVFANARAGRRDAALHLLHEIEQQGRPPRSVAYEMAIAHVALGDHDAAFASLERAYVEQHPALRYLGADERLDELRSDPRYAQVARRLGLRVQDGLLLPGRD